MQRLLAGALEPSHVASILEAFLQFFVLLIGMMRETGFTLAHHTQTIIYGRGGREARFRLTVVPAYNYTCALTGYRCVTADAGSIVDAAHIHQFADSRNNDPQNGLALTKNAHWMFDAGLWSLDDDYRVIVARDRFDEAGDDAFLLKRSAGRRIALPSRSDYWPDKGHLAWHRTKRFGQPINPSDKHSNVGQLLSASPR